jgi:hypothetical protein
MLGSVLNSKSVSLQSLDTTEFDEKSQTTSSGFLDNEAVTHHNTL